MLHTWLKIEKKAIGSTFDSMLYVSTAACSQRHVTNQDSRPLRSRLRFSCTSFSDLYRLKVISLPILVRTLESLDGGKDGVPEEKEERLYRLLEGPLAIKADYLLPAVAVTPAS